ncbi:MAG: hypothetical protein LQ346_005765 [Caloplaca aetnensis]|nr:MAG: hypothetical protein LQ346_005765 [Caloplaca aetnensis]
MVAKYLLPFLVANGLFAATGGLLVAVILISKAAMNVATTTNVTPNLLLSHAPLNSALADAGLIFATFIVSVPGLVFRNKRTWLKVHSWMVLICILVTLVIGLNVWFSTLETRSNLGVVWQQETAQMKHLLQERV